MRKLKDKLKHLGLFDILLLLFIIAGAAIFIYVFFRKTTYITITIKVSEDSVIWGPGPGTRVWFSQLFYQGIQEKDGLGKVVAQVTNVRSYDTDPTHKAVYLTLKLNSVYNRASNQYTFKGKPVLIGSTIRLYLDRLLVEGLVTQIAGVNDPREQKTLIVEAQFKEENLIYPETSGVREYMANAIKVGDEVKDNQGNELVKILEKREEIAKKIVVTSDGRVLLGNDPLKKDVYLKLQIQAIKIGEQFFIFDDVPLIVGWGIPINNSVYSIYPELTKFLSVN